MTAKSSLMKHIQLPRRAAALLTLSALSVWGQSAHAQTSTQTNAGDKPLTPVVVSASRFPNDSAFSPVGATVVTADQIRDAGITDANEAIRKLGGVYGRQSLASPGDFPLDIRGFGSNGDANMVVMVDGVRISENELTTPLLSAIPVESIERIEIVRGGSSVLYGSGATGGTIQIITKRPQANNGFGSVTAEIGTDGQRAGRAYVSKGWENMSIDANYSKAHSDNYRDNNKSNQEKAGLTVQWFGSDWRFGLRYNHASADYGLAGPLTLAQFNANPRQTLTPNNNASYDSDTITAFLERRFGSIDVAAELSHREKIARSFYGSPGEANSRSTQFSPRIRHVLESGRIKNELVAGIDLQEWVLNGTGSSLNDVRQNSKAFYVRNEIELDKNARLAAGVRRELFKQSSVISGYDATTGVNAWDIQASYAFVPTLRGFVKAGQSYRLATSDENSFSGMPFGQILKPQVSHDLEAGATWKSNGHELTAKVFQHRVRDELYLDPTIGAFGANTNLDPTRHRGIELDGRIRLNDAFLVSANYQYVQAKFVEGQFSGRTMSLVPKHKLSTRVNWKSGNQTADVGVQWVGRQAYGGELRTPQCGALMPSYTTVDARYAVRVQQWEFAVAGTNLTDRNYYSQAFGCQSSIYPEAGRAVKFTARYDF